MGKKSAVEKLKGPEPPPELDYLLGWFGELGWGRRLGQHGLEGFTWLDLKTWAELTGRHIAPHEARALMMIDLASRFPGEE